MMEFWGSEAGASSSTATCGIVHAVAARSIDTHSQSGRRGGEEGFIPNRVYPRVSATLLGCAEMFPAPSEQLETLLSGAAEVIPAQELEDRVTRAVEAGETLRVKAGGDPPPPGLHPGHAVVP